MTMPNVADPKVRSYLYRVGIAVALLLAGIGVLDDHLLSLVNVVIAAVLGVADLNVPRDEQVDA